MRKPSLTNPLLSMFPAWAEAYAMSVAFAVWGHDIYAWLWRLCFGQLTADTMVDWFYGYRAFRAIVVSLIAVRIAVISTVPWQMKLVACVIIAPFTALSYLMWARVVAAVERGHRSFDFAIHAASLAEGLWSAVAALMIVSVLCMALLAMRAISKSGHEDRSEGRRCFVGKTGRVTRSVCDVWLMLSFPVVIVNTSFVAMWWINLWIRVPAAP